MSPNNLLRCPFCGRDAIRDITADHRIRMAKENPHDQTQDFDVRFYHCNKCGRDYESTEVQTKRTVSKKE